MTVKLAVVPVFFQDDRVRADIIALYRNYDKYRRLTVNPEPANVVDLDALFDQGLLSA